MSPNTFLGIDGGGTKTEAVLIDQNHKIIKKATVNGSNANIHGFKKATENIFAAVEKLINPKEPCPQNSFFAIAGVDTKKNMEDWQKSIENHVKLSKLLAKTPIIANDIVAALRSGTEDKNAVAVIAGTGSSCWGKNKKGQEAKSGGQDYILSDEGSGFDIGSKILRSAVQNIDGRGPETLLKKMLFEELQISSLEDLNTLVYKKPWNKTDIAKVAPLAEKAAKRNDEVAIKIIKGAAHELAVMIKAVVKRLNLENESYTIVTTGSVFNIQRILCEHVEEAILKFSPKAKFTKPKVDSATAAAYLALESA